MPLLRVLLIFIIPVTSFAAQISTHSNDPFADGPTVPLLDWGNKGAGFKYDISMSSKLSTLYKGLHDESIDWKSDWTERTSLRINTQHAYDNKGFHGYYHMDAMINYTTIDKSLDFGFAYRYARLSKPRLSDETVIRYMAHIPYFYITPNWKFGPNNHWQIANRTKLEGVIIPTDPVIKNNVRGDLLIKNRIELHYQYLINKYWTVSPFVRDEITLETLSGFGFTKNRVQVGLNVEMFQYVHFASFYEYNSNLVSGGKESDVVGVEFELMI